MQKLKVTCECEEKDLSTFWQVVTVLAFLAVIVWAGLSGYSHYPLN